MHDAWTLNIQQSKKATEKLKRKNKQIKTDEQWNNAQSIFKYCWIVLVVGTLIGDIIALPESFLCFCWFLFSLLFCFIPFPSRKKYFLRFKSLSVAHAMIAREMFRIRFERLPLIAKWLIFPFFFLWRKKWSNEKEKISFYLILTLGTMLLCTPFASFKCIDINIVFSSFGSHSHFLRLDLNYNLKFMYSLRWPRVSISDF